MIKKTKNLSKLIFETTQTSPKKYSFSLVSRMQNTALDIVSALYSANDTIINLKIIDDMEKTIAFFESLFKAHLKARRKKGSKTEIMSFEYDIVYSIEALRQALLSHTYKIEKYHCFKVYEPKEREIMALCYADRIVQHSLCDNVLEPYFDTRLDYDNAACRKGKGTHFALLRLEKFLKQSYNKWGTGFYILKCDIKKYFYNIDHRILKENLYRYIEDKERLRNTLKLLREFLNDKLHLELNQKTQIFPDKNGIDYLGFHSYITDTGKVIRKLRKNSKEKMKKKIRYFSSAYERGEITLEEIKQSTASWIGHAKHGNTYNLRKKIMKGLKLKGGQNEKESFYFNDSRDYDV